MKSQTAITFFFLLLLVQTTYQFDLNTMRLSINNTNQIQMNLNSLTPIYEKLINQEVLQQIEGELDYTDLEVVKIENNITLKTVMMPYSPLYRLGQGFDVPNVVSKGTPFIQSLLNYGVKSIEGQDGSIRLRIIESASQLSDDISASASIFGSGWGVSAAASFSMNQQSSIKENQIMLKATHTIDLGKAFVDPSSFILSKSAKKLLATDQDKFRQVYGTHYIAGATMGCSMDIVLKKTVKGSDSKLAIAAELKASYSGAVQVGGEAKLSMDKSKSEDSSDTDISIIYAGNNNNVFVDGLTIADLKKAIIQFPKNCNGNINNYILKPYEKAQTFLQVQTAVDIELNNRKRKLFNEVLKTKKLTKVQEIIEQQKYMKDIDFEQIKEQNAFMENTKNNQNYNTALILMDQVFLKSLVLNKILKQALINKQVDQDKQREKDNSIFEMRLIQGEIEEEYKNYIDQLKQIQSQKGPNQYKDSINLVKKARDYLYQKQIAQISENQNDIKAQQELARKAAEAKAAEEEAQRKKDNLIKRIRIIRLEQTINEYMQIGMVRAYDKNNKEYALGRPVSSSQEHTSSYSNKIPVGQEYQRYCSDQGCTSFFHSAKQQKGEYWQVDLQQDVFITKLVVYNRQDCCQDRLKTVKATLLNSNGDLVEEAMLSSSRVVTKEFKDYS